jgi:hypothetical protein
MIKLLYPKEKPALKEISDETHIFCVVRKKWLKITPEEWVRQNFILYLQNTLGYPLSLISVEKQVQLAERKKRFDIAVYKNEKPFMLIECKEMEVPLTEKVLTQVLHYNSFLQAPILVVTNGSHCKAFEKIDNGITEIFELPNASKT